MSTSNRSNDERSGRTTAKSLLEQMRITSAEVEHRKALLGFVDEDAQALASCKSFVAARINAIVERFYEAQTAVDEIDLLIGDADTLTRLRSAMRRYVLDLFGGIYDLEYVNTRLRIGLVHKRIGVEPKLYLSAMWVLQTILRDELQTGLPSVDARSRVLASLDKLFFFDTQFVFDTYIRSLTTAVESARDRLESYASTLEQTVTLRTQQLEDLSRTDGLTGILNQRGFMSSLREAVIAAARGRAPLALVYADANGFKAVNDRDGHQAGDRAIRLVAHVMERVTGAAGVVARYGGDEFAIIMPGSVIHEARELAEKIGEELRLAECPVTLAIGIAQTGPEHVIDEDRLLGLADRCMYASKKRGGEIVSTVADARGISLVPPPMTEGKTA